MTLYRVTGVDVRTGVEVTVAVVAQDEGDARDRAAVMGLGDVIIGRFAPSVGDAPATQFAPPAAVDPP